MKLDIAIADDHEVVRDGLMRLLQLEGSYRVVSSFSTGEELLLSLRAALPDIVIMDLSMPGMGGVEAVRRLLLKCPSLKIIIFSIYKNPRLVKHLMKLGVRGYISKSSESQTIMLAIEGVAAGESIVSPDIEKGLASEQQIGLDSLSSKEFDIFRCLSEGLGTSEISEKLFLSQKTIANNISIIKKKLKVQSSNEMLHLAIKEGLFLSEY
ncbi:MAG: hypothetical protein OFPI_02850 [Osedax symbiont Rs2]|nr:MAG: hypothetical protein OFPI_02850 [Osedax symbiont Rs2]